MCFPLLVAAAGDTAGNGPGKSAGLSRLQLFAKNPADWKVIPGGAKGILLFREDSGEYSFRGEKLEPLTGYALVRYAAPRPYADMIAEGKTDRHGKLRLSGTWGRWTGKVWLVLAADTERSGDTVKAKLWHPQRYLFEEKELGLPCACKE